MPHIPSFIFLFYVLFCFGCLDDCCVRGYGHPASKFSSSFLFVFWHQFFLILFRDIFLLDAHDSSQEGGFFFSLGHPVSAMNRSITRKKRDSRVSYCVCFSQELRVFFHYCGFAVGTEAPTHFAALPICVSRVHRQHTSPPPSTRGS